MQIEIASKSKNSSKFRLWFNHRAHSYRWYCEILSWKGFGIRLWMRFYFISTTRNTFLPFGLEFTRLCSPYQLWRNLLWPFLLQLINPFYFYYWGSFYDHFTIHSRVYLIKRLIDDRKLCVSIIILSTWSSDKL